MIRTAKEKIVGMRIVKIAVVLSVVLAPSAFAVGVESTLYFLVCHKGSGERLKYPGFARALKETFFVDVQKDQVLYGENLIPLSGCTIANDRNWVCMSPWSNPVSIGATDGNLRRVTSPDAEGRTEYWVPISRWRYEILDFVFTRTKREQDVFDLARSACASASWNRD